MPELDCTTTYKDIEGRPGYRVGDDGSVWSCWDWSGIGRGTRTVQSPRWHRVAIQKNKKGHRFVRMGRDRKKYYVHRLVLEAFIGPCPPGMECRHFHDPNPGNNHLFNLRWGTPKENNADKIAHGTHNKGERNYQAKFSDEQAVQIREEYDGKWGSYSRMGKEYGVDPELIRLIVKRATYSHV